MIRPILCITSAWLLTAAVPAGTAQPVVHDVESPAGAGAGEPFLASDGEAIYMSWLEPDDEGHALRFARWDAEGWSAPRTIVSGEPFFVNWADFPSLLALGGGRLIAHWPSRSGEETYAYDVVLSRSDDGGATWSRPIRPHDDGTPTEHGFVSLLPEPAGGFSLVWLDGRGYHGEGASREMAIRFAAFDGDRFVREAVLDARVCDCCQTTAVRTASGIFVAYRDRADGEVRDISSVRLGSDGWTEPRPVHRDGWKIPACPVNGPAAAAVGDRLAIAWFTGADDPSAAAVAPGERPRRARVLAAFSEDGGATFGDPLRVDGGRPVGRVDLVFLDADRALVSWVEKTGDRAAEVRVRILRRDGTAGPPVTAAKTSSGRSSGFPRMARLDDVTLLAWTDPDDGGTVHVRRIEEDRGEGGR